MTHFLHSLALMIGDIVIVGAVLVAVAYAFRN